jgi:hypothetical protein
MNAARKPMFLSGVAGGDLDQLSGGSFGVGDSVAELATGFSLDSYHAKSEEELAEIHRSFEAFMLKHDIAKATAGSSRPCFGWLETAPEFIELGMVKFALDRYQDGLHSHPPCFR